MRLPSESVVERSLDTGLSTSCYIRLFPRQALVPLCPHPGAPSLPGPLLPPYLESCAEMLLCRHLLSPRTAPEMLVQPPRQAHHTAHHPGHRSLHFCVLPCPPHQLSSRVPCAPPAHRHPPCPHLLIRPADSPQETGGEGQRLICQAALPGAWGPGANRWGFTGGARQGLRALRFNSGVDDRPAGKVSLLSPAASHV